MRLRSIGELCLSALPRPCIDSSRALFQCPGSCLSYRQTYGSVPRRRYLCIEDKVLMVRLNAGWRCSLIESNMASIRPREPPKRLASVPRVWNPSPASWLVLSSHNKVPGFLDLIASVPEVMDPTQLVPIANQRRGYDEFDAAAVEHEDPRIGKPNESELKRRHRMHQSTEVKKPKIGNASLGSQPQAPYPVVPHVVPPLKSGVRFYNY